MKAIVNLLSIVLFIGFVPAWGWAQATAPAATDPLDLNPATNCMEVQFEEQQPAETRTVSADAIVESLRGGHCLRLLHAVIQGDLDLRTLPVNGVNASGGNLITLEAFVVIQSVFEGSLTAAATPDSQVYFSGPVVFDGTRFSNLDLTEARFAQDVSFKDAVFGSSAKIDRVRVGGSASFVDARFEKPVFFSRVQVENTLDFSGASFSSLVRAFGLKAKHVDLEGSHFSTTTDLSSWQLETLNAQKAQFDKVEFKNGQWRNSVNFDQAQFAGNADFSAVRFGNNYTTFQQAGFKKNATFAKARFLGPTTFDRVKFELSAIFHQAIFFGPVLFNKTTFQFLARLSEVRFLGWVDFGQAEFEEIDLKNSTFLAPAPNWEGASVNGPVTVDGLSSHTRWPQSPKTLQAALAKTDYFLESAQEKFRHQMEHWVHVGLVVGVGVLVVLKLL